MANTFFDTFWVLDSIGTATDEQVEIEAIRWVSTGAAAGHSVVLTDAIGNTVWETFATGANYVEESRVPVSVAGLSVTTISSGRVYIYHKLA